MKRLLYTLGCCCSLLISMACDDKDNEKPIDPGTLPGVSFSQTFITGYLDTKSIEFGDTDTSFTKSIYVEFWGTSVNEIDNSIRFWELAYRFGDENFNGYVPHIISALGLTPTDVEVTCSSDINAQYPAGSSLKEIFKLGVSSYWPYIQGGYQDKPPYYQKPISEFSGEDFLLWQTHFTLELMQTPAQSGDYEFTVTVTFEDGSSAANTITRTY